MTYIRKATLFERLADPDDEAVIDALTRCCRVCHAEPGTYCAQLTNGAPLTGRLVHLDRTSP